MLNALDDDDAAHISENKHLSVFIMSNHWWLKLSNGVCLLSQWSRGEIMIDVLAEKPMIWIFAAQQFSILPSGLELIG